MRQHRLSESASRRTIVVVGTSHSAKRGHGASTVAVVDKLSPTHSINHSRTSLAHSLSTRRWPQVCDCSCSFPGTDFSFSCWSLSLSRGCLPQVLVARSPPPVDTAGVPRVSARHVRPSHAQRRRRRVLRLRLHGASVSRACKRRRRQRRRAAAAAAAADGDVGSWRWCWARRGGRGECGRHDVAEVPILHKGSAVGVPRGCLCDEPTSQPVVVSSRVQRRRLVMCSTVR